VIGDRWGVTPAEIARRYPCDELVPEPRLELWRGVTVRAAPEQVWPWVAQIRLAPYSYDWIDNLGRRSPRRLSGLPEPVPGEPFTTALGRRPVGRIVSASPGEELTGRIMGVFMSYVLVREGASTRLLLKIAAARTAVPAVMLSIGDLIMARRQLLNIARLAEQSPAAVAPSDGGDA
jgi:hypothetical protein